MKNRREFLASAAACAALAPMGARAATEAFVPEERYMPQIVKIRDGLDPGELHIDSNFHFLYLTLGSGEAIRYGVAVGAEGRKFSGEAVIARKAKWPRWTPTSDMVAREPDLYGKWKNGMPGGPENPLGARALYLYQDGKDTLYRVHGTPQPWTIGRSVSSGCIRMINEHVADLYERVPEGTRVVVY